MAYTAPVSYSSGVIGTAAFMNTYVRDNILYLKDRVDNPARAYLQHNTTQSIPTGTSTAVAFNTEAVDSAALHDTVTNNSRITIPTGETGWWLFTAFFEFANNTTGQRKIGLYLGGATLIAEQTEGASGDGTQAHRMSIAFVYPATAAQYYEIYATQNSGGALNLAANPYFAAIRVA